MIFGRINRAHARPLPALTCAERDALALLGVLGVAFVGYWNRMPFAQVVAAAERWATHVRRYPVKDTRTGQAEYARLVLPQ